ncbi:LexA family protein [Rhodoferax sp.]|uniref:LexA family protein n=1 Tax=Rhodoferax sp. TaxID=50421 RepID=UPI00374CF820
MTSDTRHASLRRLLEIAKDAKITGPAALAASMGESEQTVTNWGRRGVSKLGAMKAQEKFGCSANWVLNGTLPRLITEASYRSLASHEKNMSPLVSIQLLSWLHAGDFCEAPTQFSWASAEELLPRPLFNISTHTFALTMLGDSMDAQDGYREGEIICIDPAISPTHGRDVLARTSRGMTLKRYKEDDEGPYLLQLNGNKIIRPVGHWSICGVVVFAGRKR